MAWRFERRRAFPSLALATREWSVLGLAAVAVVGAVGGAIRLDNGGSGVVTLAALVVAAVVLLALLVWRRSLGEGVICAALFLLSVALLLMTSLRGWYLIGHDIQNEFRVFELTSGNGAWDISRFQDPYNACLSITILPTLIGRIAYLHDPYVLKVVFQILFAVCPVLVYRIARRFTGVGVSVLAAVYFVSFPTFFTDMVFLTRQEIAFILLGAAYLVMTDEARGLRERRIWLTVMAIGVVLSHYSTAYVLIAVMAVTWLAEAAGRVEPADPAWTDARVPARTPRAIGHHASDRGHGRARGGRVGWAADRHVRAVGEDGPQLGRRGALGQPAQQPFHGRLLRSPRRRDGVALPAPRKVPQRLVRADGSRPRRRAPITRARWSIDIRRPWLTSTTSRSPRWAGPSRARGWTCPW